MNFVNFGKTWSKSSMRFSSISASTEGKAVLVTLVSEADSAGVATLDITSKRRD
jgi:hypothetical protein